jgi:hypothetical protein
VAITPSFGAPTLALLTLVVLTVLRTKEEKPFVKKVSLSVAEIGHLPALWLWRGWQNLEHLLF